jgi:hypothetical protein
MDLDRAREIADIGYPAFAPVLMDLLEWLKDYNWPVARIITPALISVGTALVPHVRTILVGNDDMWKYWIISKVIAGSPELTEALRSDLTAIAETPSVDEDREAARAAAVAVLWSATGYEGLADPVILKE